MRASGCPHRSWAGRSESGTTTVLVVVLIGVLAAGAVVIGALGGALVDHRRVEAAADLAALAAAGARLAGDEACTAARSVARRNGGTLVDCVVAGDVVLVRVVRQTSVLPGRKLTLTGRARAGPAR
jgi:secretion/DNA translocation related TadE-like protein